MKTRKGFTLLEMMIVVVIIGILAAAALPMYAEYVKKSRTGEAKNALGDIRTMQLAYYDDIMLGNHNYAGDITTLGWTTDSDDTVGKSPAYYTYATEETFSSAITTNTDTVPDNFDEMYLTHTGTLSTDSP